MKFTKRTRYLYDYKINNDKLALEKLILTYIPYIENVIKKYDYYFDLEELMSVGLESVFNSIVEYPNNKNLQLLNARIAKHLNLDISSFIKRNPCFESYELYASNNKNNEVFSYDLISNSLEYNLDIEITNILNLLKPIEKRIIEMKYGLNNKKVMTLMEIAIELSCSYQYINKIEKQTLKKINNLFSNKLKKFL